MGLLIQVGTYTTNAQHSSSFMRTRPPPLNAQKIGIRGRVADVVTCCKFSRNELRGFRAARRQFPIDVYSRPYNRSALSVLFVMLTLQVGCLWAVAQPTGGTGGPGPPRNAHQKNSEVPVDMSRGLDTVAGKMIFSCPLPYSSVRTPAAGCSSWT